MSFHLSEEKMIKILLFNQNQEAEQGACGMTQEVLPNQEMVVLRGHHPKYRLVAVCISGIVHLGHDPYFSCAHYTPNKEGAVCSLHSMI